MRARTDVIVIGGGVVGLCVARALREAGREVTVLERGRFGGECSSGNAGLVVPSHVVPLAAPGAVAQGLRWLFRRDSPFRIKPRFDPRLWRWLWTFYRACNERHVRRSIPVLRDLNLASRSLYATWADQGLDMGFRPRGLLMLYTTEKGRMKDLEEAALAREAGLDVSVHDRAGLEALTPHLPASVRGGVYYRQDALLEPTRLVTELVQHLDREGVELRRGVPVVGYERGAKTIDAVQTPEGTVRAEEVVLAAGAWSAPLARQLGLDVPVAPAKGYSVTVAAPNERPDIPFILTEEKVSVTPFGDRLRFGGTLELAGFDASVDRHRVRPILRRAAEYTSDVDPETPAAADVWVGFRPCTPDGLPVIGRDARFDNLVLATGHGMMGVSLAPITGRLVAEIVQGETPSVPIERLRPGRFT